MPVRPRSDKCGHQGSRNARCHGATTDALPRIVPIGPVCSSAVVDPSRGARLVRVAAGVLWGIQQDQKRNLNALFPRFSPISETIGLQNTAFPPTVIERETMARELVRFRGIIGHSVAMPWPHLRPDRF